MKQVEFNGRILHVEGCNTEHQSYFDGGMFVVSCKKCVLHWERNCDGTCKEMSTTDILRMVRRETAAENRDAPIADMRVAAHLHRQVGELLSALQYEEMAQDKEVEGGLVQG